MKDWPKNNKPSDYDRIMNPIVKFSAQILEYKDSGKTGKFTGYKEGVFSRVTCMPSNYWNTLRNRELEIDQGRDSLELVLGIAFRAGIEQGRRLALAVSEI